MISDKIKALFQFIEYLYSNIENLNHYNDLIEELEALDNERQKLKPHSNYKDKIQYNKVQVDIKNKFEILQDNTANKIKAKARELNVCNFDKAPVYNFNGVEAEIQQIKENFSNEDLAEIFKYKKLYIDYRNSTHKTFLSLQFFFDELDEIAKNLFDYFKDTEENEFESFETKSVQVSSIEEAIKGFKQGQTKFILPNEFLNPSKIQKNSPIVDARFWLTTFVEEQEQTKHLNKSFQREIDNNGYVIVKEDTVSVKIYTPELAVILTSKKLPALNMDTQIETAINGWEYLKTYIEAYKEGEQYFETEFKVSPNTLYGENAEQYVRDIHLNFFHVQHTGINEGWGYVKKQYPIILTHKAVKDFGYYSGIVNRVEEQIKKYPQLFATFNKSEHNFILQQTETGTERGALKIFTEYLKDIKAAFNTDEEYHQANKIIDKFFSGEQINIDNPIFVKNGNTKNLAFALGEVWRSKRNEVITYEYLEFYKKAFSIFKSQNIDRNNLFGCNLYKYSISKT